VICSGRGEPIVLFLSASFCSSSPRSPPAVSWILLRLPLRPNKSISSKACRDVKCRKRASLSVLFPLGLPSQLVFAQDAENEGKSCSIHIINPLRHTIIIAQQQEASARCFCFGARIRRPFGTFVCCHDPPVLLCLDS